MKLSLNVKGEGYAVHSSKLLLLEGTAAAREKRSRKGPMAPSWIREQEYR